MSEALRAALRRGWCPGALRPMATGDGLLVRLHPPGGRLNLADLRLVARLARETGNGLVDLTGRGNLQIRGVGAASHGDLVAGLIEGGLVDADEDVGPYRLTLVSPLAGRDPTDLADAGALAAGIEALRRSVPGLPAKTGIVVDGGGCLSLDDVPADLRIRAVAPDGVLIGLAGDRWFGPLALGAVPGVVGPLLSGLATLHRARPEHVRRMRDVPEQDIATLFASHGVQPTRAPPARPGPLQAGSFREAGETTAILFGAPFGRCTASQIGSLADIAQAAGAADIRLSPWRGLAMTGLAATEAVVARIAALGFITAPGDPRLAVRACPGAPACSRGETAAQEDAVRFAAAAARRLAGGMTLHVSGCAKGCAQPGIADVTLVGHDGAYHIVLDGTAGDLPFARRTAVDLASDLACEGDFRRHLQGVSSS
ncbi:MAG: precorrin-3B synthase [Rhizobiales bacterium]|nr:precorrin-3B synthase [Hyphomicrobiales bacterium]